MKLASVNEKNMCKLRRYLELKTVLEDIKNRKKDYVEVSLEYSLPNYGNLWNEYMSVEDCIDILSNKLRKFESEIKNF